MKSSESVEKVLISVKHNLIGWATAFLMSVVFLTVFAGCSNENEPQPLPETDYVKLAQASVEEFLEFAKTPRPSNYMDKAQAYMIEWATRHGYQCSTDSTQNVWIDVPATYGLDNYPIVILQGHMDMVCASPAGETYDYKEVVGEPYYDGNLLKGKKVNLGVDNGIGCGTALAIADLGIPHGPLRLLFTTHEENGMTGAIALDPNVLDADYLINLDGGPTGEVIYGCAGGFTKDLTKTYQRITSAGGLSKVSFKVLGLKGGHSAGISVKSLSGSAILAKILKEVVAAHDGKLIFIDCGTYFNAIPTFATIDFAVDSAQLSIVKSQLDTIIENYKQVFPDENATWTVESASLLTEEKVFENLAVTEINTLFEQTPQGMLEKSESGRTVRSNNIGVVRLTEEKLYFSFMTRSDYMDWLTLESVRYDDLAKNLQVTITTPTNYPSWDGSLENKLSRTLLDSYMKIYPQSTSGKTMGGLEPAYFVVKKPELICASIGPTEVNGHTIDEYLELNSMRPFVQALAVTLVEIGK